MSKYLLIKDDVYPPAEIKYIRKTSRAIALWQGKVGLIHIEYTDNFGVRNHYETPGGGLEKGETYQQAIIREMKEEIGATGKIIADLGLIAVEYKILERIDLSRFFLFRVEKIDNPHPTEFEKKCNATPVWMPMDEAIMICSHYKEDNVEKIIYQRELHMLKKAQKLLGI